MAVINTDVPADEQMLTHENEEINNESEIFSGPASDGAIAVISGDLPGTAQAAIEAVTLSVEELIAYFGEEKAETMRSFVAYDISIMADGEEWQPDDTVSVVIRHPDIEVSESETVAVAHVDGITDTVSEVAAEISEAGDVTFEAEGFSTYIIYTVDFRYGEYTYSIEGESELLLSELFVRLGIGADAADVVSVEFSDPSLLGVEQTENDWNLISYLPFLTEETLTVTFADGKVLTIAVTDDSAPVEAGATVIHPTTSDAWYANDKLTPNAREEYAYFYHTETKVNEELVEGKHYIFTNDADTDGDDDTYNRIEFRNAFHCYGQAFNICIQITLNSPIEGTIRWGDRTFLDTGDGATYLSVGLFSVDEYSTEELTALMPFDITWDMWLEDPATGELVTWIPLMGGSCFVGREYVTVYSTDNCIYHNFPIRNRTETLLYYGESAGKKIAGQTVTGWYNSIGDNGTNDSPSVYALGMVDETGHVYGRYVTEWTATGPNSFACELTANLYANTGTLMVEKIVEGKDPNPNGTDYHFRIQRSGTSGSAYSSITGSYTVYNMDGTTAGTVNLGSNGELTLKDGQHISVAYGSGRNYRIYEYTSNGTNPRNYDYFEYLDETTAMVNGASAALTEDTATGTKMVSIPRGSQDSMV